MDTKQQHKRIGILAAVATIVVGFLARQNAKNFERTVLKNAYEQLQTIAKTEAQHVERHIIDNYDELRVLAENPKVKENIINGRTDKQGTDIDGYCPEKLVSDALISADTLDCAEGVWKVSLKIKWRV